MNAQTFAIIKESAAVRLKCTNQDHRLESISNNIPCDFNSEIHGSHTRCYRLYTNVSKLRKRESQPDQDFEALSSPSTSKRRRSATDPSSSTILFPSNQCLFCDKDTITVKRVKQSLVKCVNKCAEESIRSAAIATNDEVLLGKISQQDLVAKEAHYHNHCRRNYTRNQSRHVPHEGSESSKTQQAHGDAFEYLCTYIEEQIMVGQNVERMTMLRERYLAYLLEHYPAEYNENYKTYKLKEKLIKHFAGKLCFWQPSYKSELVYAADTQGQAVEMAFELAASEEKRLQESAMILRRQVINSQRQSEAMPWPPSSSWLLSGQRKPPDIVKNFFACAITSKSTKEISNKNDRLSTSLAEDLCYAVTNGEWTMPKHILLPMTIRHLTGSAEVITIINRFGHGQSYTKTLELETALCNTVIMSESVLPVNISTENNVVLHLCWDNFDLNEETPSGPGTTHSTHGIAIQKVALPATSSGVPVQRDESQPTVPTKQRTVKPQEVVIKPCYAKARVEPNILVTNKKPVYNFDQNHFQIFTWLICREMGSTFDQQTMPSYSGWLSITDTETSSSKSVVEYMAPLNVSINENSTVQHILETSLAASQAIGQQYAIVTFDLAVAKKAYALVWQLPYLKNVIVRMGVFHTICSLFGTIGKMM